MNIFFFLRPFFFILLSSCAVGPNYKPPAIDLPSTYSIKSPQSKSLIELNKWWEYFEDPMLNEYICEATKKNLNLKVAIEKVHEVRSLYQIDSRELYPKIDLSAEERRYRISQTLFDSKFLGPTLQNFYQIGFDSSWELDFFGKKKRKKEAAFYQYEAEINSTRDIYITLLSEIAATYIRIRSMQNQLMLTELSAENYSEMFKLVDDRVKCGLENEVEILKIKQKKDTITATIPPLKNMLQQQINRLSVLVGKTPEVLAGDLIHKINKIPESSKEIPVGLPADLLRRRPDVRHAEKILAKETAGVGEAIADLFPQFSILGSYNVESNNRKKLFSASSRSWSLGPDVNWPIIYFGSIRANIRAQNSKAQQALLHYEQVILDSIEDVENALIAFNKEQERSKVLKTCLDNVENRYQLIKDQYTSGLADLQTLIDAYIHVLDAKKDLTYSQEELSINRVALYKSLGGDW